MNDEDEELTDDRIAEIMKEDRCLFLTKDEADQASRVLEIFDVDVDHVKVDPDSASSLAASFDEWVVFISIAGSLGDFLSGFIASLRWHYYQQWGLEEGTVYENIDECPGSYRDRFMDLVGSGDEPLVKILHDGLLAAADTGSNYLVRDLLEYDATNPEPSVKKVIDAEIKKRFDHLMEEMVEEAGYY